MDVTISSKSKGIDPLKFGLWAGFASIIMMFIALTSAYIVRQSAGNWLEFKLPTAFIYSTLTIIISSITLHMSYVGFKKGNETSYKLFLIATLALGLIFIMFQYQGWQEMHNIGVDLDGNPSGSFVYVISGLHAAHVLGGLAVLTVAIMHAFSLPYKPTEKRRLRFQLTTQYWHFVDILWVYLFLFFLFFR
ncbi:MAG: cytochrome c oxidase subunit 3 [Bacteroidetes bacterium]|jgi:cytochrome c oxidase subunit 3|nr:cytochrome c oxidase subunit 3 [Bacteroidota bacterium]MCB0605838.1 cytochrome c oxidase subunit 3 [Saprospiraceae bacterium]MCO5277715.1 cytochrome c oxidase subunit 3 [Saprospiraceae bacterium]HMT76059.1 cytochrome c oxidase subunit 3 [Saprospiraceae bacterium]